MEATNPLLVAGLPFGDQVHWNEHEQLVITGSAVLERITRPYLSVSTAKAVEKCPASYVADRALKGGFDLMGAAELGTAAHTVMERLFTMPPVRRNETNAAKILVELAREEPADPRDPDYARILGTDPVMYAQWVSAVSAAYSSLFQIEDPRDVDIVANEFEFKDITLENVPVKGYIDRVDRVELSGEKVIRVVDYKTGKPKLKKPHASFGDPHGDQVKTYVEAYETVTGERPKMGQLLYTGPGGGARRVAVSRAETRKVTKDLALSWSFLNRLIADETFPTRTSPLCGWCPLVNACPAARREGKTDRKTGAPTEVELGLTVPEPASTPAPTSGPEVPTPTTQISEGQYANEENTIMTDTAPAPAPVTEWPEARPYDGATIATSAGMLPNLAAYAAGTTYGLVYLAIEILNGADQKLTPTAIDAMADTLVVIHRKIQRLVTGGDTVNNGAANRMHGVLRTVLDVTPAPFGQNTATWNEWANRCVQRGITIANKANALMLYGPAKSDHPWTALASDPMPEGPPVDAWDAPVPVDVH